MGKRDESLRFVSLAHRLRTLGSGLGMLPVAAVLYQLRAPATPCCRPWPRCCATTCAAWTRPAGSAATSSAWCCPRPASNAREVAERLRQRVEQACAVAGEPCTLSLGVTEAGPQHLDVEAWIKQADMALYLAKAQGRNRACATAVAAAS